MVQYATSIHEMKTQEQCQTFMYGSYIDQCQLPLPDLVQKNKKIRKEKLINNKSPSLNIVWLKTAPRYPGWIRDPGEHIQSKNWKTTKRLKWKQMWCTLKMRKSRTKNQKYSIEVKIKWVQGLIEGDQINYVTTFEHKLSRLGLRITHYMMHEFFRILTDTELM